MLDRREFLVRGGGSSLAFTLAAFGLCDEGRPPSGEPSAAGERHGTGRTGGSGDSGSSNGSGAAELTLFLAGDVMTGRGVDQILPQSVDPVLHEPAVTDARRYVELAERESGPIPEDVAYDYIWGDALEELARIAPHARVINLETAVTTSDNAWPGKGIHYRMHPQNVPVLTAAGIDVCALGNNHVLDWGYDGLAETVSTLDSAGVRGPGAGADIEAATEPAVIETAAGRLLVFSYGARDAGVPAAWAAAPEQAGVAFLPDFAQARADRIAEHIAGYREDGDRVVLSLHWGGNWGYAIPPHHRDFAHTLIDANAVDVVHGHSSHHPRAIEVYRGRPIFYGCGDFINDYEGIGGREQYRAELTAMYFPTLSASGERARLVLTPMRIERFRLRRARGEDARWLAERLDRESRQFGTRVELTDDERLRVRY